MCVRFNNITLTLVQKDMKERQINLNFWVKKDGI